MAFTFVRQLQHRIRTRLAGSSWRVLRWLVDDSERHARKTRLWRQVAPTHPHIQPGRFRKRRSITPPPRNKKGLPTNSQSQSLLLSQLPLELREMIWKESVSDMTLHLRQRRRVGVISQNQGVSFAPCRNPTPLSDLHKNDSGAWIFLDKRRLTGKYQALLHLPRTCRQIYSETINMLYNSNMFAISDMHCIEYLHLFLLPQRVSQIRSLTIFWELAARASQALPTKKIREQEQKSKQIAWDNVWNTFASMDGLQNLEITFNSTRNVWGDLYGAEMTQLLAPTKAVSAPKRYQINFPFDVDVKRVPWSDVPYLIGRVPSERSNWRATYLPDNDQSYDLPF